MNQTAQASPGLLVYCTCPDNAGGATLADSLAESLVSERLAACVSSLPVRSVYRWNDGVETASECLLLIKTCAGEYDALQRRIVELHPYELPEVIAVPISDGLPGYLEWIAASVGKARGANPANTGPAGRKR